MTAPDPALVERVARKMWIEGEADGSPWDDLNDRLKEAFSDAARCAVAETLAALRESGWLASGQGSKEQGLIGAVQSWTEDCEGRPDHPSDARLLKAIWTYEGDHTEPCDECDGECGEPCAPCTVAQAHASLDRWVADWERKRGITKLPAPPAAAPDGGE